MGGREEREVGSLQPTPSPNPFTFPEKKANMKKRKGGREKKDTKTNG